MADTTALTKIATRFRAKATDPFNVAVADITEVADSRVQSLKQTVSEKYIGPAQSFLAAGKAKVDDVKNAVESNANVRMARSAYGLVKDVSKISKTDVTGAIVDMIPGNLGALKSKLTNLGASCMEKAASWDGLGKRFDVDMTCGSGKKSKSGNSACSSSSYGDVLNKLSGGSYASTFNDLNKSLKAVVALSKIGYDMNMCGVLGALLQGDLLKDVGGSLMSRATAAIVAGVAGEGNANSTIDSVSAIPTDVDPTMDVPGLTAIATENYTLPSNVSESDIADHGEAYVDTLILLDGEYTDVDSQLDVTKLRSNDALENTLNVRTMASGVVDVTDLDTVVARPEANLSLLYMTKNPAMALAA